MNLNSLLSTDHSSLVFSSDIGQEENQKRKLSNENNNGSDSTNKRICMTAAPVLSSYSLENSIIDQSNLTANQPQKSNETNHITKEVANSVLLNLADDLPLDVVLENSSGIIQFSVQTYPKIVKVLNLDLNLSSSPITLICQCPEILKCLLKVFEQETKEGCTIWWLNNRCFPKELNLSKTELQLGFEELLYYQNHVTNEDVKNLIDKTLLILIEKTIDMKNISFQAKFELFDGLLNNRLPLSTSIFDEIYKALSQLCADLQDQFQQSSLAFQSSCIEEFVLLQTYGKYAKDLKMLWKSYCPEISQLFPNIQILELKAKRENCIDLSQHFSIELKDKLEILLIEGPYKRLENNKVPYMVNKDPLILKKLKSLTLVNLNFKPGTFAQLTCPDLTELDISDCYHLDWEELKSFISKAPQLKKLDLNISKVDIEGCQDVCLKLEHIWRLQQQFPQVKISGDRLPPQSRYLRPSHIRSYFSHFYDLTFLQEQDSDVQRNELLGPHNLDTWNFEHISTIFDDLSSINGDIENFLSCELARNTNTLRYSNICAYDWNVVKTSNCNITPIYSNSGTVRFLAQAPLEESIGDFWSFVFQNDIQTIVMTLSSNDKSHPDKFNCYFPTIEDPLLNVSTQSQNFSLKWVKNSTNDVHEFQLEDLETKEVKIITHISVDWKDNKEVTPNILGYIVCKIQKREKETRSNTLIHCSAGVGRTGTVMAALTMTEILQELIELNRQENCTYDLNQISPINIVRLLTWLRFQRKGLVQTAQQLKSVIDFYKYLLDQRRKSLANTSKTTK